MGDVRKYVWCEDSSSGYIFWNVIFNASNCGDNCAKWLLEMGRKKDITINLRHMMDFGDGDFELKILNTGEIVHNMEQLDIAAGGFV